MFTRYRERSYAPTVFRFDAELWLWKAAESWHFVTVPADISDEIEGRNSAALPSSTKSRGFGSVRVRVTIGATTWTTSVFPDKQRAAYVLPVKKAVRRAEDLAPGDLASVTLELLEA